MFPFVLTCRQRWSVSRLFSFLQTGEKSGQVEKSKKNARQRQNDFKVQEDVSDQLQYYFLRCTRWSLWDVSPLFAPLTASFTENDRRANQQTGEAHSGGSAPHHSATRGAERLRRLGGQDGADGSLADADHPHRQVLLALLAWRRVRALHQPSAVFVDLLVVFLLPPPGLVTKLCRLWRSQTICCRWSRTCCWSWGCTVSWWACCSRQKVSVPSRQADAAETETCFLTRTPKTFLGTSAERFRVRAQ